MQGGSLQEIVDAIVMQLQQNANLINVEGELI